MSCISLKRDLDLSCVRPIRKFAQQAVLVNRQDVDIQSIRTLVHQNKCLDRTLNFPCCNHSVLFKLKEDLRGFRFTSPEQGGNIFGSFQKTVKNSIPQYLHSVQIPILGMSEEIMCLLKELDNGDYFCALQFGDDIVIYGYEYGLSTADYTYDPQAGFGGGLLTLTSNDEYLEDEPPFIYESQNGTEIEDFDNNFEDVVFVELGDFNEDFNNDFNT